MTQSVWPLILLVFATILGKLIKNTKPMRAIYPHRGWLIVGTGIMLFSYTWLTMSQPFTLPFLIFPILFIVLGLLMLNKERKMKKRQT